MRQSLSALVVTTGLAGAALVLGAAPAAAKTCKEPVTATSRSTVQAGEEARTRRATSNAERKWSKEVRAKYGLQYYFWMRAEAKKVECRQTPKSTVCTATATPCSLL